MKMYFQICFFVATGATFAAAQPWTFNEIVAFGDSLSDVGNLHSDRPHVAAPEPPYFEGRFSNGPNWVDRLAEHLGAERPLASELGGKNYAWAAAAARDDLNWFCDLEPDFSVPSISDQIAEFLANGEPQGNQLFSVWAGHNDLWPKYDLACATTPDTRRDAEKSVNSLVSQYVALLDAGVQNLLIPNLSIHERIGANLVPEFNAALAERIAGLRMIYPSASIYEFDFSAFMDAMVAEPAVFGITEPIAPGCRNCWGGPGDDVVVDPDEHFYWDRHHISRKGNQILADAVYREFFSLKGDIDLNGALDAADIDLLSAEIRAAVPRPWFDFNGDDLVNDADRVMWVESLIGTFFGDADLNGTVEFADFLVLSGSFGKEGGWAQGDFDGNGEVQFADFLAMSTNFNMSASAVAAVPEPTAAVPAIFWLAVIAFLRHR